MGLSIITIEEEDCGTKGFLKTTIIDKSHIKTLIGKWYKLKENDKEWLLLTGENDIQVGQEICLRSPIYCITPDRKICQKCFGEKKFNTKYLGILAGQILSERLTQLTLRSFHESGSAQLTVDKTLKSFIKNHLTDIEYSKTDTIALVFDTDEIPDEFKTYPNYQITTGNNVYFINSLETQQNNDPVAILRNIKIILKVAKTNIKQPNEYYDLLMSQILTVGAPYSSFVELLLANMFLTDTKNNSLWRYDQTATIKCKLGDKTLSSKTSPLLNLLYQQNNKTISKIEFLNDYLDNGQLTIYEKMFLEKF